MKRISSIHDFSELAQFLRLRKVGGLVSMVGNRYLTIAGGAGATSITDEPHTENRTF